MKIIAHVCDNLANHNKDHFRSINIVYHDDIKLWFISAHTVRLDRINFCPYCGKDLNDEIKE